MRDRLVALVRATPWLVTALQAVRDEGLASWCIGAGAVRNVVWDHLHGHTVPSALADVDVAYFDGDDLCPKSERAIEARLRAAHPSLPWEVTNQAAVHRGFEAHFGHAVAPLRSLDEAVGSWPEYATSVGLWLDAHDALHVIAPHGLDDLFAMTVRRNPIRVSVDTYRQRCAAKRYAERWPRVRVLAC
ncbi:nucleotidyltransferase family protein [Pseudaquabacterium terrae]|uniref:nucleotidyltransferase family protein n=1 Tax=Pseudaquabacterium terrae TaxID=2732868 RepID=UPI001C27CD8F|nr:nucleotidyltransferase family protein [Aquabacterium terrae]